MYGCLRLTIGILAVVAVVVASGARAQPSVSGVRIGDHAESTRFVIDVSNEFAFRIFTLPDPYRVVIDVPELKWDAPLAPQGTARGLIDRYRFGLFEPGTSRIVLDVTGPVKVRRAFVLAPQGSNPYRFVVDLAPSDRRTFLAEKYGKRRKKRWEAPPAVAHERGTNGRRVVVIDTGHGGVDPGTISKSGHYEKNVTLAAGLALKTLLEKKGRYRVVMTRSRDIFIPLEKRVAIGRQSGADLFLSLHADSIGNRKVRGATVYTLSETASDSEAAALARKENKSDIIAGVDLDGESPLLREILIDLMQRETMNYSAEFANLLIPEMAQTMVLRTNSHRFAGFRVLKAPDVPSVLIEMGYLSNTKDVQMLTSPQGINRVAQAVARAIDAYFRRREAQAGMP